MHGTNFGSNCCVLLFERYTAAIVGKDINGLLDRATELEAQGNKIIAEFKNHSKSHLLSALEHEIKQVEHIAKTLKEQAANASHRDHQLNALEENLLYFENRLGEELDFVLDVYHYNSTGKSKDELINFGEKLIKDAKEVVAKHEAHGHREILTLNSEIHAIERLIKELQTHPTGRLHELEEAALIRNEKTLRALIERIHSHH